MNEKIREKIKETLLGHNVSPDTRKRISQTLRGRRKAVIHKNRIAESMKKFWKNKKLNNIVK